MLSYTLIATQLQFSRMLGRCFDIDTIVVVIVVVKQSTIANVTMVEENKRHGKTKPLNPKGMCRIRVHLSCTQNKNLNSL